jgi:hypothetical protein
MGYLLPPGQKTLIKPQQAKLWERFLLKADIVKNRMIWYISKWLISPPPVERMGGLFSDTHCENHVGVLEDPTHQSVGSLMIGLPREFSTLDFSPVSF